MSNANAWLEVENLHVTFNTAAGPLPAVRGVDLHIGHGEVLGLVGESGSGKSALASTLMGLHRPGSCTISASIHRLGEQSLLRLPEHHWCSLRGRKMAMVFQDPMTALNPYLTVGSQLAEVLQLHTTLQRAATKARCLRMLAQVGLTNGESLLNAYPHALSGGMRQRVVIAMALLAGPELLIADEPTTALDVTIQAQILALLRQLGLQSRMAMLLISHDLGVIAGIAHRIAVMYAGQVVEVSTCDALFAAPKHPYTAALMQAMPDTLGADGDGVLMAPAPIAGAPPDLRGLPPGCAFAPRCARVQPQCRAEAPMLEALGQGTSLRCFNPVPYVKHL